MAFRVMIFVLLFNLASGLLAVSLADYYTSGLPYGIEYNSEYDTMEDFKGSAAAPGADASSGWWDKFMDFLKIGFFQKIIGILDNSLYGFSTILQNLGLLNDDYNVYIKLVLTMIYAIGIVDLYTGRRITG